MSRMSRFNFRFSLGAVLTLALVGLIGSAPANADIWPGLNEQRCMADAYGGKLNCTANDVEITNVNPIDGDGDRATLPDGTANPDYDAVECVPGSTFQLNADLTIRTNANERWDTTFYMPLNDKSPMDLQNDEPNCSLAVPDPDDISTEVDLDGKPQPAYSDLDSDECGDITKALGSDQYTLYDEEITMYCKPSPDDPTRALFTYCAAWENQTGDNCYADVNYTSPNGYYGQVPSQKSKCKCDAFAIDVFIKPDPPTITKTLVSPTPGTLPEPGGVYTFDLSFTNVSSASSIFVSSLTDEIDITGDGFYDVTLDLWGTTVTPGPDPADGVYLVASNCTKGSPLYEIDPSGTYSCRFSVHIVDTDLPDDQSPEFYDDVIKVAIQDKNGDPVINGGSCPDDLNAADGEHCSDVVRVEVTNKPPEITVTKTPDKLEILEPGDDVTFTFMVSSNSGSYDDPLTITSLMDSYFGDLTDTTLNPGSTCVTGGDLSLGTPYSCTLTAYIAGNRDETHSNTVTAKAVDNENDEATDTGAATVNINDVPSAIRLVKSTVPEPTSVPETGDDTSVFRDVTYKFEFSVLDSVVVGGVTVPTTDSVTFSSLLDDIDYTNDGTIDVEDFPLTPLCMVDTKNGSPIEPTALNGFTLAPGESASCTITQQVQGNAGVTWFDEATIYGTDDDGLELSWSDTATVTFDNAELDIKPELAMKATAFVRISNDGVDTADITALKIKQMNLVPGAGIEGEFEILDEAASSSYDDGDGPYSFCSTGVAIAPKETYECAFTLKLYPGFDCGDINFAAAGLDALTVKLEDDDGSTDSVIVPISIATDEPDCP